MMDLGELRTSGAAFDLITNWSINKPVSLKMH